jgi:hypothetical protein
MGLFAPRKLERLRQPSSAGAGCRAKEAGSTWGLSLRNGREPRAAGGLRYALEWSVSETKAGRKNLYAKDYSISVILSSNCCHWMKVDCE